MKALLILVMAVAALGASLEHPDPSPASDLPDNALCVPGSRWKEECNWCSCADNGLALCTLMACFPGYKASQGESVCSEGSRWKADDCNWCRCIDGTPACTKRLCRTKIAKGIFASQTEETECYGDPDTNRWRIECNWCRCVNGKGSCTRKGCPQVIMDRLANTNECEGTPTWTKGCNTCSCVNGHAHCTTEECDKLVQSPSVPAVAVRSGGQQENADLDALDDSLPDYGQCVPGSRWKKDCNWCSCTEKAIGICTLIGCLSNYQPKPGEAVCTDGSRWKDDCNWCTCNNGSAACTEKLCLPDGSLPENAVCVPGSRWKDECNWCWCDANGSAPCTRRGCSKDYQPKLGEAVCIDGSRWKMDDCNWCTCNNGSAACTEKLCLKPGGQCTEGESWRQDCNICHCSNGLAICTLKACSVPTPRIHPCQGEAENGCSIQELPHHCKLPPFTTDGGECEALLHKWTYDFNSGKCESVIYGGCGGTKNLYDTEEECKASCSPIPTSLPPRTGRKASTRSERCFKKQDAGPCFGYFIRYSFNAETKQCEEFIYGGCSGNDNRFTTPQECHETCGNVARDLGSSCNRSRCPWMRWAHYFAKDCLPRYERGSCCPTSFSCPSADAADPEKCSYRGQVYSKGSIVPVEDPCTASCICTDSYVPGFPVEIHCAEKECPEFFMPPKPGCRPLYKPGRCCSSESDCVDPETPPLLESRSATCVWNNRTYLEGDKMYFEDFPCQQCICSPAFTDPNGPLCSKVNCGLDFRYSSKYTEGCVPIYFENKCCPIDWLCPGDGRILLPEAVNPNSGTGENLKATLPVECYLGSLNIGLGSALNTSECNLNCRCITPPEPTCVQYRSCTLAQVADLIKECPVTSCALGCDFIMDAATGCFVCSCKDENFICPQHTCPSNCENVLDLQTGCLLCKCDCSYDSAGRPHCPVDCDVYEFVDEFTGCKKCECNLNITNSTSVARQLCPVDFSGRAPCPMDCAIRRVVDETTGCETCECDPDKTINPFRPHILPPPPPRDNSHILPPPLASNCPTYANGQVPCPMDCAIRRVVDETTGCETCECDPDKTINPFRPHILPPPPRDNSHILPPPLDSNCPTYANGQVPCPMDCAIRRVVDETTGCEKCECDPDKTINPFRPHGLPPPPRDSNCPIDATGQVPCPVDCAIRRVVDEKTGCEICECDPNNPGHPFGSHSPPLIVNT